MSGERRGRQWSVILGGGRGVRWRHALLLLPAAVGFLVGALVPDANDMIVTATADITLRNLAWGAGGVLSALAWGAALLWGCGCWRGRRDAKRLARKETHRFQLNLDHELKNRLNAVRGGLDYVEGLDLTLDDRRVIDIAKEEVILLSRMTETLRHLVTVEQTEIEHQQIEIGPLLRRLCETIEEQPERSGRRIIMSVPEAWPLPRVPGDEDMLSVALYNLVDNACKYTRPGDLVEVTASREDGHVVIGVADTGPGIPPSDIHRIWEPLFRGQDARSVPGSGLGLALVKAIVARHGGTISADSVPGERTRFEVRLPTQN